MVKVSPMVRSFNAGIFSQLVEGRTDLERYPASMRRMHNVIAAPQGPALCRSGTMFVVPVAEHDQHSFLLPFIFSNEQAKVLEFAFDRIRFIDEDGIQVYPSVAHTASTTTPFVITSATLGANIGDDVVLGGYPLDYNLNGEVARIISKTGDDYTLNLTWPTGKASVGGTVARVYHVPFDYTTIERERLRVVQSVDVMYLLNGSQPRKLLRYSAYDWRLEKIKFKDGPYLPINETTTTLTPSQTGNAVSVMTGPNTPSGVASADTERPAVTGGFYGDTDSTPYRFLGRNQPFSMDAAPAWHAFDDDDTTYWAGNVQQKGKLKYDFGASTTIDGYSIQASRDNRDETYLARDFAPSKFTLEGSNDDAVWTVIDDQQEYVLYDNDKTRFIELEAPATYRYYQLNVSKLLRNGPIEARVRRLVLRIQGRGGAEDQTSGATISNATATGAVFDNGFNQVAGVGAYKNATAANSMYVGKTLAAPRAIANVRFSGSNDNGYANPTLFDDITDRAVTFRLYAKTGAAPANGTDGTLLGTLTINDNPGFFTGSNQSAIRTIASNDPTTLWDHVWLNVTQPNNKPIYLSEVRFAGWGATGAMTIEASSVVGINRDQGFLQGDVGRLIRMKGRDNYWRALRIESVVDTTHVTATLEGEPFPDVRAIKEWRLGAWGDSVGWPTCGDFFEDRLCLGGSIDYPDLFAMSVIGQYEDFSQTDEFGVVLDESAVVARLNARKLSGIRWLAGDEKGLLIGTGSGEYLLSSVKGDTESVTARNIKARNSTSRGSADVEPVKVDRQVLYVQRTGRTMRELAYVFEADGYKSPSMSQLASHLGVKRFKEIDYAAEPHSIVWVRREDGSVVGLTYNRDESVVGWHTHDFGGAVESMTVVPAKDQLQDTLWLIVNRTVDGAQKRYIERLTRFWDFDMTLAEAHYLDSALRYVGDPVTVLYGLQHLEGREVYALADQKPVGPFIVTNGSVELQFEASDIIIGEGYDSDGETSRLENGAQDGTAIGKKGRIHNVSLLLWDSYGGEVGVWNDDDLADDAARFEGVKYYDPVEYPMRTDQSETTDLYTGEIGPIIMPSHDKKCSVAFRRPKKSPLPFNVVAIMPQMNKEDRG